MGYIMMFWHIYKQIFNTLLYAFVTRFICNLIIYSIGMHAFICFWVLCLVFLTYQLFFCQYSLFDFITFFWDRVLLCCPGWSPVAWSRLTANSVPKGSSGSSASASWVARIKGAHHHIWLIFEFLVEMGFHHIGQADLKLLTS